MSTTGERQPIDPMVQRAEALQAPLSQLVDLGLYLHRSMRPTAPRLRDVPEDAPCWYVASMNTHNGLPMSDSLTLNFGDGEYINIDRHNGLGPTQPVWRFDHWFTYDDTRMQRTSVRVFDEQSGATFPFDIETILYREGRIHDSFLGSGYEDQEPHIDKFLDRMLSLVAQE